MSHRAPTAQKALNDCPVSALGWRVLGESVDIVIQVWFLVISTPAWARLSVSLYDKLQNLHSLLRDGQGGPMTLQEILAARALNGDALQDPPPQKKKEPRSPSLNAPESVHSVTELGPEKILTGWNDRLNLIG